MIASSISSSIFGREPARWGPSRTVGGQTLIFKGATAPSAVTGTPQPLKSPSAPHESGALGPRAPHVPMREISRYSAACAKPPSHCVSSSQSNPIRGLAGVIVPSKSPSQQLHSAVTAHHTTTSCPNCECYGQHTILYMKTTGTHRNLKTTGPLEHALLP